MYLNQLKESDDENMWYLDNGANDHKTGSKVPFSKLDEMVTEQVQFGDGSKVPIKGKAHYCLIEKMVINSSSLMYITSEPYTST